MASKRSGPILAVGTRRSRRAKPGSLILALSRAVSPYTSSRVWLGGVVFIQRLQHALVKEAEPISRAGGVSLRRLAFFSVL